MSRVGLVGSSALDVQAARGCGSRQRSALPVSRRGLRDEFGRAGLGRVEFDLAAIGGGLRQGGLGLGKEPSAEEIAAEPSRVVLNRQVAGALHGAQEPLDGSDREAGEPGKRADGGPSREALVVEKRPQGIVVGEQRGAGRDVEEGRIMLAH